MRHFTSSLLIIFIISLAACEKETDSVEVDAYVDQLKSSSYNLSELPDFHSSDIPTLLQYRNDTMLIENFPRNGISSLWMAECTLGMYVLWTIESIRATEIQSGLLMGRFPSQNPILALRSSAELQLVNDMKSQAEAARAYYLWWHSVHLFSNKMNTDPLKDTDYRWH